MNFKKTLTSIREIGISNTYRAYKSRKADKVYHKQSHQKSLSTIKELTEIFAKLNKETSPDELSVMVLKVSKLLDKIDMNAYSSEMAGLEELMKEKETRAYKNEVKKQYIKEIIPNEYLKHSSTPVGNKVLFMQPSRGFTLSLRYTHDKLIEKHSEYDVRYHELLLGKASSSLAYHNALVFFRQMATAKAVFMHTATNLMGHFKVRDETKVIQLWHGCGVYKSVGLDRAKKSGDNSMQKYIDYPQHKNYTLVTVSSPESIKTYSQFMDIDENEGIIKATGVSRTDIFFDDKFIESSYKKLYKKIPSAKQKKVILYAPTFRGTSPRLAPDALDIEKFAELSDEYVLIIKHHQSATRLPSIPEELNNVFAFEMSHSVDMDINELLIVANICISDYSSLIYEFALFERPMIFFAYDQEEYSEERGLYDYENTTPGPIFKTNEEIIDYIHHIDERFDKQEVTNFKNKYMSACDGHATERIFRYLAEDNEKELYHVLSSGD